MPSHVALNLVNGMLKFTTTKNELLTSFKKLFDFAYLYLNGIIGPTYDTTCFLIKSDVPGTVEMDHRSVCFDVC